MREQLQPKISTNVRISNTSTPLPKIITQVLRLAPFLRQPVLTRLFLTPQRSRKAPPPPLGTTIGQVRINQREITIRARGQGPTILLVHGWQGHSGHLMTLGTNLVSQGFTVVSFDMPAHGESKGRTTSLKEFIDTLFAVKKLLGPVHAIVAHSLGATASALALSRGLQANAAVLIAPLISFDFALDEFSRILGLNETLREVTARGTEAKIGMTRQEADLNHLRFDQLPLLLVHDVEDKRTLVQHTQLLHQTWKNSSLHITQGLGHRRILDDPSVYRHISTFLEEIPPSTSEPLDFPIVPELSL